VPGVWTQPLSGLFLPHPSILPELRGQAGGRLHRVGDIGSTRTGVASAGRVHHSQGVAAGVPQEPETAGAALPLCLGDPAGDAPGGLPGGGREGGGCHRHPDGWRPDRMATLTCTPWFPTRSGRATDGACRSVIWTRTR
jgi:hypothetical protein